MLKHVQQGVEMVICALHVRGVQARENTTKDSWNDIA